MAETYENAPAALPKNSEALRDAVLAFVKSLDEGKLDPSGQKVAAMVLGEYLRIQENMKRYWDSKIAQLEAEVEAEAEIARWNNIED